MWFKNNDGEFIKNEERKDLFYDVEIEDELKIPQSFFISIVIV